MNSKTLVRSSAGLYALLLALVLSWGSPLAAQEVLFVADSGNDAVYRMVDLDGNGAIDPATETFVYYDDSSPGPDLSTPSHVLVVGNALLVADGGTLDAILRLEDLNGDGDANDAGEVIPFYDDTSPGLDLSTPNGLAASSTGDIFVADDGAAVRAILRLRDENGDGDANDVGESSVYYDTTALAPLDPIFDAESVAVTAGDVVYVGDSTIGMVFRLEDLNGDGDALDEDEAVIFYSIAGGEPLQDIDALVPDGVDGLYAVDEDDGTVLHLRDLNDDHDALDPGEMVVFLDGSISTDPNDAILRSDGSLLLADGALDALVVVRDLDGDGTAASPGEVELFFDDGGALLATPSGVAVVPAPPMTPTPLLASVTPSSGPVAGGTVVTLVGMHFTGAVEVAFGASVSSNFAVVDDETIEAVTPAHPAGPVSVTVETPGGASTLVDGFEFTAPVNLEITSALPATGPVEGGTPVILGGTGWDPSVPLEVTFDATLATITGVTSSEIQVVTPAQGPGLVDISVSQGAASAVLTDGFRYQTPFVRGDADRSGQLNLGDGILVLRFLFATPGPSLPCLDAADVNDSNEIDLADALHLLEYLFQAGPTPASPFPAPGLDPTPSGPGCEF